MRYALGIVLLLWLAPVLHASESVSGEGYRLTLPAGLVEPRADSGRACRDLAATVFRSSCAVAGEPDMRIWVRGDVGAPEAVLVLLRLELRDSGDAGKLESLDKMQQAMAPLRSECEQRGIRCTIHERRAGGHKGFEVLVDGVGEGEGSPVQGLRLLYVPLGEAVFALMYMNTTTETGDFSREWEGMVAGLHLRAPGLPGWLLPAGALLGVLALGLLVVRRAGRRAPVARRALGPAQDDGYTSPILRPGPGDLPPAGQARLAASTATAASGAPAAGGGMTAPHSMAAPPPGLRPTWDPQRAAESARAAPKPSAPPAVPASASSAPSSHTLRPTIPPGGRWSDVARERTAASEAATPPSQRNSQRA